jgi:hypothetical protein
MVCRDALLQTPVAEQLPLIPIVSAHIDKTIFILKALFTGFSAASTGLSFSSAS